MKVQRLLALTVLVLASVSALGQQKVATQPDCRRDFYFTAAGVSADYDNRSTACTSWLFVYQSNGFSVVSTEFQSAPDSNQAPGSYVTWANLASGSLPLTSTVGGSISGFRYQPWVRVKVTTATGTGQLNGTLLGWRPFPGQDATTVINGSGTLASQVQGAGASAATTVGNPVVIAGVNVADGKTYAFAAGSSGTIGTTNSFVPVDAMANLSGRVAYDQAASGQNAALLVYSGIFNGATWDRQSYCPNTSTFSVASTTTQVVALSGTTKVRICSLSLNPSTVTAGNVDVVYGTGSNCGTGTTTLSGAYTLPASAVVSITPALSSFGALTTPAGQAVCVRTTTATVAGFITWGQW